MNNTFVCVFIYSLQGIDVRGVRIKPNELVKTHMTIITDSF